MTGLRQTGQPYTIANNLINSNDLNDSDLSNISYYSFNIQHGSHTSSLILNKSRNLDGPPDHIFSYRNGIKNITYSEEAPPSFATASSSDGDIRFDYGNAPKGKIGIKLEGTYSSKGEAMEAAKSKILFEQDNIKQISLVTNKGFYLDIGNIIRIDVPEDNLYGQYRITSKQISYSRDNVTCNITLGRKPITLSTALNRII
jgi:hypothetical protein